MAIQGYRDLIVWQKSVRLVVLIYEITSKYPKKEIFGLVSQSRRCAVSIPANIAEGSMRSSRKDLRQFLIIAQASGAELEIQIEIAKRLKFLAEDSFKEIDSPLSEVMKMLTALINKMG